MKTVTLPAQTQKLVDSYRNLPGITINTPYFVNHSQHHFASAVKVGKGTAEEIATVLQAIANQDGKEERSTTEWTQLALMHNIGIDCSGLVTYMLETFMHEKGKFSEKTLKDFLIVKGSFLHKLATLVNFDKNTNADTLTSDENCKKIEVVKDARVSDLIRFSEGHHVGFISTLIYNDVGDLTELHFYHATEGAGVSEDRIMITKQDTAIQFQGWQDNPKAKRQPFYLFKRGINDNGIRRLNFLA